MPCITRGKINIVCKYIFSRKIGNFRERIRTFDTGIIPLDEFAVNVDDIAAAFFHQFADGGRIGLPARLLGASGVVVVVQQRPAGL